MLQFRILGPLEVGNRDGPVELAGQRQRSLLALLLLHANHVVSSDALVDALWGEHPPRTATTSLQNGISQLRKAIGADAVVTRPPGYSLRIEPDQLDLTRFERLVERARTEPPDERAATLREALALWRGEPLAEFAYEPFAQDEIHRLAELRVAAQEELLAAELDAGRAAEVAAEAEALLGKHPLRERLRGLQMLALYRCGRQAEALQAYHEARRTLDEELGLEPAAELQALHRSILRHDPSLAPSAAGARPTAGLDEAGEIADAVAAARLVVVLGPGVAGPAPTGPAAAEHLARIFNLPPTVGRDLARAAQHVAVVQGVGRLYDELDALYAAGAPPGPVHRALAETALALQAQGLPQQLVVTAGFDCFAEQALAEAGIAPDVVSYVALGRDRGKFLHRSPDGTSRIVAEPNVELGLVPGERPVVLRIHGGADAGERGSYVVSEDDYIDYLAASEPAALLPVGLAARLRRSHLLFLGYELEDWSLRVFLRRLWGEERIAYRSWAVSRSAPPVVVDYWRRRGVEVVDATPEDAVADLRRRLEEPVAREVPA